MWGRYIDGVDPIFERLSREGATTAATQYTYSTPTLQQSHSVPLPQLIWSTLNPLYSPQH